MLDPKISNQVLATPTMMGFHGNCCKQEKEKELNSLYVQIQIAMHRNTFLKPKLNKGKEKLTQIFQLMWNTLERIVVMRDQKCKMFLTPHIKLQGKRTKMKAGLLMNIRPWLLMNIQPWLLMNIQPGLLMTSQPGLLMSIQPGLLMTQLPQCHQLNKEGVTKNYYKDGIFTPTPIVLLFGFYMLWNTSYSYMTALSFYPNLLGHPLPMFDFGALCVCVCALHTRVWLQSQKLVLNNGHSISCCVYVD